MSMKVEVPDIASSQVGVYLLSKAMYYARKVHKCIVIPFLRARGAYDNMSYGGWIDTQCRRTRSPLYVSPPHFCSNAVVVFLIPAPHGRHALLRTQSLVLYEKVKRCAQRRMSRVGIALPALIFSKPLSAIFSKPYQPSSQNLISHLLKALVNYLLKALVNHLLKALVNHLLVPDSRPERSLGATSNASGGAFDVAGELAGRASGGIRAQGYRR